MLGCGMTEAAHQETTVLEKKAIYKKNYQKQGIKQTKNSALQRYHTIANTFLSDLKRPFLLTVLESIRLRQKFIKIAKVYGCLVMFKLANICTIYPPFNCMAVYLRGTTEL